MKIETDEWTTMPEVMAATGMAQKTLYRVVDRLGIGQWFFGVRCVRKADVQRIVEAKMPTGNPRWIGNSDDAAEAAIRAVESRMKRTAERGQTAAEKRRNQRLAAIGRKSGGRPAKVKEPR